MPIGETIKTLLTTGWNVALIGAPTIHVIPHYPTNRIERTLYVVDNGEISIAVGSSDHSLEFWAVPFSVVIFEKDQTNAEKSASQAKAILLRDKTANTFYTFDGYKLERDLKICEARLEGHQISIKGDDQV